MIGRRVFLGATGAFATVAGRAARGGVRPPEMQDIGEEKMRFGVLSDIHITTSKQQPYFEKALRQLDAWKVDGVLACGDLADYGLEQQLQLVADSWFKVFPDGKGSDGRTVVNLMHYGDHDMSQSYWDLEEARKAWPSAEARKNGIIFDGDRKAIWERCFKEPWAPIQIKTVKGFDFILSHFTRGEPTNKYGHNTPGLEEFFAARKFDPAKPAARFWARPRQILTRVRARPFSRSIRIWLLSVDTAIRLVRMRRASGRVRSRAYRCRRCVTAARCADAKTATRRLTARRFRRTR